MTEMATRLEERDPHRGRPGFAKGYGVNLDEEGMLSLDWAREQLEKSRNYWVATTRPDGRPHASPVWGIWLDDSVMFGTSRVSRKGRNLADNPEVVVHVESGDDVVILEGRVEELTDRATLVRYADAYEAKYSFRPNVDTPGESDVTYRLRPSVLLAWKEQDFLKTPVRWVFDGV